ncbi:MAG: ABC transporter permease subunit [Oscillospiraceae bacterium]|nr:ABC transporter permease subunit [Oscillospiraceae bacterium]MDD3833354.1 ABC transporter permease subunit [Oscillospiraceae bacterium]
MMNSTTTSKNKNKINRLLTGLGAAAFWLVVWQVISMLVAQELLVPAPLVVLKALSGLVRTSDFWQSAGRSLLRILLGFLLGVIAGSGAAVMTTRFKTADALLSPLLRLVRATPVASFIILALVWIKTGYLPSFISFLMVVPLVWNNVESGIKHIDIRLLEMAKVFRLSWFKTLIFVRIPSVMPYFMAACTAGMGLAWKSGIAAEVICRPPFSIGNQLQNAKSHLETPQVFAWTITIILLSLVLEKLLVSFAAGFGKRFNAGGGN